MFRRRALQDVAGYDATNYRNVDEDRDVCVRLQQRGFRTEALSGPVTHSLQDLSMWEMARKDNIRMGLGDASPGKRAAGAVQKAARRTYRHLREGHHALIPRDWGVGAVGVVSAFRTRRLSR